MINPRYLLMVVIREPDGRISRMTSAATYTRSQLMFNAWMRNDVVTGSIAPDVQVGVRVPVKPEAKQDKDRICLAAWKIADPSYKPWCCSKYEQLIGWEYWVYSRGRANHPRCYEGEFMGKE